MADRIVSATFPDSSAVQSAEYNLTRSILTVYYKSNPTRPYSYAAVPESVWNALNKAKSVGSYVSRYVVGKYAEVVPEDEATRNRKAMKLLEAIVAEARRNQKRGVVGPGKLFTSTAFDISWLPQAEALVDGF